MLPRVYSVLVCDDEEVVRALVRATLAEGAYEIREASTGDEALERVRSARPDLVLLDMMMPGRGGLDVLRELRADADLNDLPVILLTARTHAADRAAAAEAGADHYLGKPFSPAELAALVAKTLEQGWSRH